MKKRFALLLTGAITISAAFGVMAAEEMNGDWYGNMFGMGMHLVLAEDGTYIIGMMEDESIEGLEGDEGSWEMDGDTLYLDKGTDYEQIFTFDGENLSADVEGMEFLFSRDEEAAIGFVPAEAIADAALEDYAGTWKATQLSCFGMTAPLDMFEVETAILEIEDAKVTFTLDGGFMFGEAALADTEGTFADGALTFIQPAEAEEMEDTEWTAQLLEDGTMSLSFLMDEEPACFYLEPAEAAEEAETEA